MKDGVEDRLVMDVVVKEKPEVKSIVLVVDDESTVCRALSRMLRKQADEILSAISPGEAETVLATRTVTHVICDHWFGSGQPLGLDLVSKWKNEYPSIKRVIVLTGTDISKLEANPNVDCIMDKTVDPDELIKVLGLG